jgi:hypothetical protein
MDAGCRRSRSGDRSDPLREMTRVTFRIWDCWRAVVLHLSCNAKQFAAPDRLNGSIMQKRYATTLSLIAFLSCVHREPPRQSAGDASAAARGKPDGVAAPSSSATREVASGGVERQRRENASGVQALPSATCGIASAPATAAPARTELSASPTPSAIPRSTRVFRDTLGLNVKFTQGQPNSDLPTLLELGVRWVRDTVDWATLEPSPGQFVAFPRQFLERVAYYRAHHIGIVFLLAYENRAAYPATREDPLRPINPTAFGRYAQVVAQRLRELGAEFVLEIWNEPHNFVIRPMLSGGWNGKPPAPWLLHYLKMAKAAVEQVKAVDPTIPLLTDDDMWIIHYWYLEAGLPNRLDGFAFHPYTLAGPERAAIDKDTDWVHPFQVVDDDGSFQSAVRRLRDHGRKKLGKAPQMWITEWGWAIGQKSPYGPVTEELLAAWLPRAYVIAAASGVMVTCWFSARDSVDGPMGLMDNNGRKRKPYFALKALSQNLGDWSLVKHLWGAARPTKGLQAFLFEQREQRRLMVWNAEQQTVRLPLRGSLTNAIVSDANGQILTLSADTQGRRSVEVGASPMYLTSRQLSADEPAPP